MANRNTNPRNSGHELFRKLTKLLSGPISNYKQQNVRHPRRVQLDQYSKKFKSASGQTFKKSEYGQKGNYAANYMANQNRADRYLDFDQMVWEFGTKYPDGNPNWVHISWVSHRPNRKQEVIAIKENGKTKYVKDIEEYLNNK